MALQPTTEPLPREEWSDRGPTPPGLFAFRRPSPDRAHYGYRCPYGAPGDRLWCKESFWSERQEQAGTGAVRWGYHLDGAYRPGAIYRADDDAEADRWKPSIHMPRCLSRITLEIVDVRVQRLQDISEEDARAEGVEPKPCCSSGCGHGLGHVEAFAELWESINGERACWGSNPWVWCLSFRRVQP